MAVKILILLPRIPYPLRDGGSIAMNQSIEAYLEQGCDVSVVAMNTSRHWVEEGSLPAIYQQLSFFKSIYVKTDINPLSAFFNLFSDKSYNVARFINKEFDKELVRLLQNDEFDIIQFESIYTAPYLETTRKHSQAKCFCRVHNIEHLIWQRLTDHESSFLKRNYLKILTQRLKTYEEQILTRFDMLLPISKKEQEFFVSTTKNPCYYLPFGIDITNSLPNIECEQQSMYHIGSMDWAPNVEGVHWFLDEVWPLVHEQSPEITLYLAGKNMPASILSRKDHKLVVVGEVDDVVRFSLEKNIMIVPLLSGAGVRIKILEAMAMGKTIITTSIGAEGIGATHQQHLLIVTLHYYRIKLQ
ncbi:MAG TPA: glycosyltransferase, partial [Chitinophagaceae bacterium]|nr:glycosyltransferase [Chitinophagaceae bacterium]